MKTQDEILDEQQAKKYLQLIVAFATIALILLVVNTAQAFADPATSQCTLVVENGQSIHKNTMIRVTTDSGVYTIHNVENRPYQVSSKVIEYLDKNSIRKHVIEGPDGISSLDLKTVKCFDKKPTTTVAPTTTVIENTTTTSLPKAPVNDLPQAEPATPIQNEEALSQLTG